MKTAIIYHSQTGNTKKVAELILRTAEKVKAEAKCMSIDEVDKAYVKEADIIFFGTPTYAGSYSWQMKKWLDTCTPNLKLAGKVGCVFATEDFLGGGADNAELALLSTLLVRGMFVYSVGVNMDEGLPFTHFGAVCIKDGNKEEKERVELFTERVIKNVKKLMNRDKH